MVGDEAAAEAATADLEERTARLPDPDAERRWWTWWDATGQDALTRLLREQWNPIGDVELPADEYAAYARRLGDLLREGISEQEIVIFLADARTGALGLPADPDGDARVGALVHDWYRQAHRAVE